jgi:hypothetical protein
MDAVFYGKRKRFLIYLNQDVYKAFRQLCRSKQKRANRLIESFMLTAIENPFWLEYFSRQHPQVFHEPSEVEEKSERVKRLIEEAEKVLEALK